MIKPQFLDGSASTYHLATLLMGSRVPIKVALKPWFVFIWYDIMIYIWLYIYIYTWRTQCHCVYVHIFMYILMYIYIYRERVVIYIYIYIYIHVHIENIHTQFYRVLHMLSLLLCIQPVARTTLRTSAPSTMAIMPSTTPTYLDKVGKGDFWNGRSEKILQKFWRKTHRIWGNLGNLWGTQTEIQSKLRVEPHR